MSDYQEMVREEAKALFDKAYPIYQGDSEEHGGKCSSPNLSKWLDRTRMLFGRLDELKKDWTRADAEMIKNNSRNSVPYGDPIESAYFACYKDIMKELKKLRKISS